MKSRYSIPSANRLGLVLSLVSAGAISSLTAPSSQAAPFSFRGTVDSDWANVANWRDSLNQPATVLPAGADIAWINLGHTARVTSNVGTVDHIRVGSDSSGGTLIIGVGGSLTANTLSLGRSTSLDSKTGTLTIDGGSLRLLSTTTSLNVGLRDKDTGTSAGILNIRSGSLETAGTIYVGGTGGDGLAQGTVNIYGSAATVNLTGGFFWVTENSGSTIRWDFAGGDDLTTIQTNANWRLFGGNSYIIDFANFVGAEGDYEIALLSSTGIGNANVGNYFSFLNTQYVSSYSVTQLGASSNGNVILKFTATAVPEPSTYALVVLTAGAFVVARRRKAKQASLSASL